jgi:hypothetical protein
MDKFIEIVVSRGKAIVYGRGSNAYGRKMEWLTLQAAPHNIEEVIREARAAGLVVHMDNFGCGFVHN